MQRQAPKPAMTPLDCQRLHDVIASALAGVNASTPQAGLFFAVAGSFLISQVHRRAARPVAGAAFYRVGDDSDAALAFGNVDDMDGRVFSDDDAFHCWIECDATAIDLQVPVFQPRAPSRRRDAPALWTVFHRPLTQMSRSPFDLRREGDFFLRRDPALSIRLMDSFMAAQERVELVKVCLDRYRPQTQSGPMSHPVRSRNEAVSIRDAQLNSIAL